MTVVPTRAERPLDFDELCRGYFDYIWASLHRLGVRGADAEDLAHDVLIVVHRRLPSYDTARPLKPWIFGVTYNVVRNHRKRTRTGHANEPGAAEHDVADGAPGPLEAIDRREQKRLVERALMALPEERRAVFVLYEIDEVPMAEVAEVLGIPRQTGYSRLRRGREEFRRAVIALQGEDPNG